MKSKIEINIKNGKYDDKMVDFLIDMLEALNFEFDLKLYCGAAEKIYNKAYIENYDKGLMEVLNKAFDLGEFFVENMLIVKEICDK